MMDQAHIGYTYWQQPPRQTMPVIREIKDSVDSVSKTTNQNTITADLRPGKEWIPENVKGNIFYERKGYVSIEAAHYTRKNETGQIIWKLIPGIGREGDGITSFPVTKQGEPLDGKLSPSLEYEFYASDTGSFSLNAFFSPTLNVYNDPDGLQYAVSVDHDPQQVVSINKDDHDQKQWSQWVSDNIIIKRTFHAVTKKGKHTITFYRVSPAVILQKIVLDFGGMKQSSLGPPETRANPQNK